MNLYSAGVGRSGTYITLDTMLQRMPHTNDANVYEFVQNMRKKRVQMVQTQVGNTQCVCLCACACAPACEHVCICTCSCVHVRVHANVLFSSIHLQAQYTFVHDALEELITCGDTSFSVQNMTSRMTELSSVIPGKEITGFKEQFEVYLCDSIN